MKKANIIGMDVGKDFSYVCLMNPQAELILKPFKMSNTLEGFQICLQKIKEASGPNPVILVLEHTNIYTGIIRRFFNRSMDSIPINPVETHNRTKSSIRQSKTDKKDAIRIAQTFILGNFSKGYEPSEEIRELKKLTRTSRLLINKRSDIKRILFSNINDAFPGIHRIFNPLSLKSAVFTVKYFLSLDSLSDFDSTLYEENVKTIANSSPKWAYDKTLLVQDLIAEIEVLGAHLQSHKTVILSLFSVVEALDNNIKRIENQILNLVDKRPETQLLTTIPGIRELAAGHILAEIGDIRRFKYAKQLIAFAGTDPKVQQSGNYTKLGLKITKAGSRFLRQTAYVLALTMTRKYKSKTINPVLYEYYQKRKIHKNKRVVIIAIANKILRYIFAVLTSGKPFKLIQPEEHVKNHLRLVAA